VGAIEKDKSADLALFDADPLSPGAKVKMVIIAGEVVYRAEDVK
jgi:imidazolonepropionase-like amidohydrolase